MENTNEQIEITSDEFIEKYKPIRENDNIKYFDTHSDWEEVQAQIDAKKVWTMIDTGGSSLGLQSGCWMVNRMEYLICEVPYEGERGDIFIDW